MLEQVSIQGINAAVRKPVIFLLHKSEYKDFVEAIDDKKLSNLNLFRLVLWIRSVLMYGKFQW